MGMILLVASAAMADCRNNYASLAPTSAAARPIPASETRVHSAYSKAHFSIRLKLWGKKLLVLENKALESGAHEPFWATPRLPRVPVSGSIGGKLSPSRVEVKVGPEGSLSFRNWEAEKVEPEPPVHGHYHSPHWESFELQLPALAPCLEEYAPALPEGTPPSSSSDGNSRISRHRGCLVYVHLRAVITDRGLSVTSVLLNGRRVSLTRQGDQVWAQSPEDARRFEFPSAP